MKLQVLKFPDCRGNIEIEEGMSQCYCKYCGCKIVIDDGKSEVAVNANINMNRTVRHIDDAKIIKEQLKDKRDKRSVLIGSLGGFVPLVVVIVIVLSFVIDGKVAESQGWVSVGDSDDLIGQDYKTVVTHFESAGFEDIETIDLNDAGIFFWSDGEVAHISIAGDNSFESVDYFPLDSKVVISYH